jgi:hypothetical protein
MLAPNQSLEGTVNGLRIRGAGAEEIVRPQRLIGCFWAAPQLHRYVPWKVGRVPPNA